MIKYFLILLSFQAFSQSFAPEPGALGSTAIFKDSSAIIGWASNVAIVRGPMNILAPQNGDANYGLDSDATGAANGGVVVSLGDGGEAIATFENPIVNGIGPDFAIFENGFADHYMEFAFVEVSSDGINFFRFENTSEVPINQQIGNFSFSDCRYVNNLAGKYRVSYGTPFDLAELANETGLDVSNITHVKLIDVIGSIDPAVGSYDSFGNIINDPFPTEFESGGFDLDAIAVLNNTTNTISRKDNDLYGVYPNPFTTSISIVGLESNLDVEVIDVMGKVVFTGRTEFNRLNLNSLKSGIYWLVLSGASPIKIIKTE